MDLTKVRPGHLVSPAFWRRGFYTVRELARAPQQSVARAAAIEELYCPDKDARPLERSLRILVAAPRYDYGDARRGEGIEEHYFLKTLVSMGHHVIRFDSLTLLRTHGKAAMNRMLHEAVKRYEPDVMMTVMFKEEFEPTAISHLTDILGRRTFNWFCDDQWRFETYSRRWAGHFGWVVTTSRATEQRYRAEGLQNVIISQWGCNHFVYKPLLLAKALDVSFVGQPHGDRPQVISALRRAGIKVDVWGLGWPAGRILQEQMMQVFSKSRINLNLSNASVGCVDQVKGRDFEVPGCGGFLISKQSDELARCYEPGREVETYVSLDDLIEKVRHYLSAETEREQISHAGHARTLSEHTMEARLTKVLQHVTSGRP